MFAITAKTIKMNINNNPLFELIPKPSILFDTDAKRSAGAVHLLAVMTHAGCIPVGHASGANDSV